MPDEREVEAYYTRLSINGNEVIRIQYGDLAEYEYADLDIRDAVFLQFQLQGAIDDYTKAAGR